jgi:hypothetical protein
MFDLEAAEKNWRFFEINSQILPSNSAAYSHTYDLFYDIGVRAGLNEIRKLRELLKEEFFNREWESGKYRDKETAMEVAELKLKSRGII